MSMPQLLVTTSQSAGSPRYTLLVAQQQAEVHAAQRLRHDVFAGELGAVLHSSQPGLDVDEFDAYCDHLVVREDRTGEIVGTYRMLPPEGARCAGGLYCETEFAVPGLVGLRLGPTTHPWRARRRARGRCLGDSASPAPRTRAVPGAAAPAVGR
jgi:putative hemolysin